MPAEYVVGITPPPDVRRSFEQTQITYMMPYVRSGNRFGLGTTETRPAEIIKTLGGGSPVHDAGLISWWMSVGGFVLHGLDPAVQLVDNHGKMLQIPSPPTLTEQAGYDPNLHALSFQRLETCGFLVPVLRELYPDKSIGLWWTLGPTMNQANYYQTLNPVA